MAFSQFPISIDKIIYILSFHSIKRAWQTKYWIKQKKNKKQTIKVNAR